MLTPTIHATAVLAGPRALVIRGPARSGKSHLAWRLIAAAQAGVMRFARLIGDDRVHIEAAHGRLLVRPAPALAGLLEVRGVGIRRLPFEPVAVAGLVIDLASGEVPRLPAAEDAVAELAGIALPRLTVPNGCDALPLILALREPGEGSPLPITVSI